MNNVAKLGLCAVALGLMGVPLAAQQLTYGGQLTVAMPAGPLTSKDWLDGQVGGGAGGHIVVGLSGGHAMVPRFDYTYFKKSQDGVDRKVQMFQCGADYNYFLRGKVNDGPYVGAGFGFGYAKFELTGLGHSVDDSPISPFGALSGGWMFTRHMGAELRYTYACYKPNVIAFTPRNYAEKPTIDSGTVNASFIYRF